jgi:hypothetical protein
VWGRSWQKTLSFSIRQEFKVIHVTLLMYLASLVFIPYLYKKIEMNWKYPLVANRFANNLFARIPACGKPYIPLLISMNTMPL